MLGPKRCTFDEDMETELAAFLTEMESRLFGLTSRDVRSLAFQLAERNKLEHTFNKETGLAGKDWFRGFMHRHPNLAIRSPEPTSAARARSFNRENVDQFFKLLENLMDTHHFMVHRVFNVDETGITTVQNKPSKIIAKKGKKQVGSLTSAERGTLTTAVICMSASGIYVPPMLIFPRVRMNPALTLGAPPGTIFECDKSGWMQSHLFTNWMKHFINFTKPSETDPILLVLDGHRTHTKNIEAIDLAKKHHVHMIVIPPHCSHRMQPLDVSFMKPLSSFYSRAMERYLRNHPGKVITLYQVSSLFAEAYLNAAVPNNAISGFTKTGIHPVNRDAYTDADFVAAETTIIKKSDCDFASTTKAATNPPVETSSVKKMSKSIHRFSVDLDEESESEDEVPRPKETCCNHDPTDGVKLVDQPGCSSNIFSINETASVDMDSRILADVTNELSSRMATSATKPDSEFGSGFGVRPSMIIPIPQQRQSSATNNPTRPRRGGNRRGFTTILTSSEYHLSLEQASSGKKKEKCKTVKSHQKSGATSADTFCLYCGDTYFRSNRGEKWVQCLGCKDWAHAECCENPDEKLYMCEFCQ